MQLTERLRPEMVLIDAAAADRDELFALFAHGFAAMGEVGDSSEVVRRLTEREEVLSTGIGGGVAVPHAQIPGLGRVAMAASTHPRGLVYPSLDSVPVRLVFCLLGDTDTTADHLAGLARLARLARRSEAVDELVSAGSSADFVAVLRRLESP